MGIVDSLNLALIGLAIAMGCLLLAAALCVVAIVLKLFGK